MSNLHFRRCLDLFSSLSLSLLISLHLWTWVFSPWAVGFLVVVNNPAVTKSNIYFPVTFNPTKDDRLTRGSVTTGACTDVGCGCGNICASRTLYFAFTGSSAQFTILVKLCTEALEETYCPATASKCSCEVGYWYQGGGGVALTITGPTAEVSTIASSPSLQIGELTLTDPLQDHLDVLQEWNRNYLGSGDSGKYTSCLAVANSKIDVCSQVPAVAYMCPLSCLSAFRNNLGFTPNNYLGDFDKIMASACSEKLGCASAAAGRCGTRSILQLFCPTTYDELMGSGCSACSGLFTTGDQIRIKDNIPYMSMGDTAIIKCPDKTHGRRLAVTVSISVAPKVVAQVIRCKDQPDNTCLGKNQAGWTQFACRNALTYCKHSKWGQEARRCCPYTCGLCATNIPLQHTASYKDVCGAQKCPQVQKLLSFQTKTMDKDIIAITCANIREFVCPFTNFPRFMEGGTKDPCKPAPNFFLGSVTNPSCTVRCAVGYIRRDGATTDSTLRCGIQSKIIGYPDCIKITTPTPPTTTAPTTTPTTEKTTPSTDTILATKPKITTPKTTTKTTTTPLTTTTTTIILNNTNASIVQDADNCNRLSSSLGLGGTACMDDAMVVVAVASAGGSVSICICILIICCICCACKRKSREERDEDDKKVVHVHHHYANGKGEGPSKMSDDDYNDYGNPNVAIDMAVAEGGVISPPHPISERTFATSNFKRRYALGKAPKYQHTMMRDVETTIRSWAKRTGAPSEEVEVYFEKIQKEVFKNHKHLTADLSVAAEYMWTSGKQLRGAEFCFMLNDIIRNDIDEEIQAVVPIVRLVNQRRVTRDSGISLLEQSYPPKGVCWRGGGFRNEFKPFFIVGKCYRIPGFLATSAQETVAASFVFKADHTKPRVKWRIEMDPAGKNNADKRPTHMSFVNKTHIQGEGEYLFAPYSVFTVKRVEWSDNLEKFSLIVVKSAVDNRKHSEQLALAPWY